MERTTERVSVQRELEIAAGPETVWRFLVDPDKTAIWWGAQASLDARVGGSYRIESAPGNVVRGEFLEVEPPRRLVYTFGWESGSEELTLGVPPGSSTVEIELIPSGSGTTLRLVHRDLPNAELAAAHNHGWDHYLGRLAIAVSGEDPGPDPWAAGAM